MKVRILKSLTALGMSSLVSSLATSAVAAVPSATQINLPKPANELAQMMADFHNLYLLPICFGISIFVLLLLVYVCFRYREKANPVPSKTTHNTTLEVVWTIVPILILGLLFVPSMRLLYATDKALDFAFTVKIIGNQWYWRYEYPDHENLGFDSYMVATEDLQPGQLRLMSVDNPLVIPEDTPILLQFTAEDVLHAWAVSDFGVRMDTVPGQLNEMPLYPVKEAGTYYGFCSELCGADHSFMPIEVKVVSKQEFASWLKSAKQEFAQADDVYEVGQLAKAETFLSPLN